LKITQEIEMMTFNEMLQQTEVGDLNSKYRKVEIDLPNGDMLDCIGYRADGNIRPGAMRRDYFLNGKRISKDKTKELLKQ
jgi:hypothetical protein